MSRHLIADLSENGELTVSFRSWLPIRRSAPAPRRVQRHFRREILFRTVAHRLNLEFLEDRSLLSLSPAVSYPVGTNPQAVVTADFNNDGRFDLVTANRDNDTVSVLLGNGNGTFQPATTSATGATPVSLATGDFNRDGRLDLATANQNGSDLSVLLGNGNGTFQTQRLIDVDWTPNSVAVGDFNGDGKLDLAVTSNFYYPGSYTTGLASVLLGVGDGSFSAPIIGNTAMDRPINSEAVGDFNGDGKLDLVTCDNAYGEIQVLPGDGRGKLNPSGYIRNAANAHAVSMVTGDLNADGKLDLVMASGYDVGVLLGNGAGGFSSWYPQHLTAGDEPTSVVLGDFDHDGRLDIAAASGNEVSILRGEGDGTFNSRDAFAAGPGAAAVAAGELNGDGWIDVAAANAGGNSASVLINDRSWPFLPPTVSINAVTTVFEGNTGSVNGTFTVTLSHASNVDVTVHYATEDGTAVAGSDYIAGSGTVVIPAGQISAPITIAVLGDRLPEEPNETFAVKLSDTTNAAIAYSKAGGVIVDDEPLISISDVSKSEGTKNKTTQFTFTVTLSLPYDQPVTVSFQTVNGTATTGDNDYVAKAGTLTFAPGETTKTITIDVTGDNKKEATEMFYLDLFDNSSNSFLNKKRGIGTILNDDGR
jgi:hypothetical protein